MKFSSLVGHIVELLELIQKSFNTTEQNDRAMPRPAPPADRIVAEFFRSRKYLGSHDRRFIAHTVYGIIRFRRRIDVLIDQYLAEHPSVTQSNSQRARYLLQFIAYAVAVEEIDPQQIQTGMQERWLVVEPVIPLGEVVYWMAQNKSLRFHQGDDLHQLADWYSFEEWMVKEWVDRFGLSEAEDLLHALNGEAPIVLRVNTRKTSVEACRERLNEEGIETTPARYAPCGLIAKKRFNAQSSRAFQDGWYEIQDEGSQIICYLVEPQPGQFVVDACAGAGGKTLLLGEIMQNKGEIAAFDSDLRRLRELEKRRARAGIDIIVTQQPDRLHPGDLLGKADRVLVDAPCTGIGTVRRNPSLKWTIKPAMVESYAHRQANILETSASYVRPGGRLVYATCSLFQKENEDVVEQFLERRTEFQPAVPRAILTNLGIEIKTAESFVTLFPHRHGTDGFFVAVLEKKG
jgi:16S rRNA (cytosine967-C5)-methyltransferase